MRIFYFITKSEAGGAQTVVASLLQEHKRRGDTVMVMASGQGWLAQETAALGFAYAENNYMRKTYNPFVLLRAAATFHAAVRRFRPDIVSLHSSFSGFIGRLTLLHAVPTVYTSHGWGFTYNGRNAHLLNVLAEKIAGLFSEKIICVSERDKAIAVQYRIAQAQKLTVIHNGVAIPTIHREAQHSPHIVFCGRFALPKRQDLLVSAFALLPEAVRNTASIAFLGDGPTKETMRQKAIMLGIEKHITFPGSLSQAKVADELTKSTIAVLLSDSEGLPMTVLEAMAYGVPVIASRVGGIPEVLTGTCGYLVSNDPLEIRNALEELLTNEDRRMEMGDHAQQRIKNSFSLEQFYEKTFNLYEGLLRSYRSSQLNDDAVAE